MTWLCGAEAARALRLFIDGRQATCRERGTDQYERIVAVCHAGGQDLNGRLVAEGMAILESRIGAWRLASIPILIHEIITNQGV